MRRRLSRSARAQPLSRVSRSHRGPRSKGLWMRIFRLPLLLALVAALTLGAPGAGSSADSALLEVVVTFKGEGAPSAADVAALEAAGITTAITFQALPIAGALATAAKADALAASPQVASVYPQQRADLRQRDLDEPDRRRQRARGHEADQEERQPARHRPRRHRARERLRRRRHATWTPLRRARRPERAGGDQPAPWSDLAPVTYLENVRTPTRPAVTARTCAGTSAAPARARTASTGRRAGRELVGYGSGAGSRSSTRSAASTTPSRNQDRFSIRSA